MRLELNPADSVGYYACCLISGGFSLGIYSWGYNTGIGIRHPSPSTSTTIGS